MALSTADEFVKLLVRAGVKMGEIESIISAPDSLRYAERLKPYVTMFGKEAAMMEELRKKSAARA